MSRDRRELMHSVCSVCNVNPPERDRAICSYCKHAIQLERRERTDSFTHIDPPRQPIDRYKRGPGVARMLRRRAIQAALIRKARERAKAGG